MATENKKIWQKQIVDGQAQLVPVGAAGASGDVSKEIISTGFPDLGFEKTGTDVEPFLYPSPDTKFFYSYDEEEFKIDFIPEPDRNIKISELGYVTVTVSYINPMDNMLTRRKVGLNDASPDSINIVKGTDRITVTIKDTILHYFAGCPVRVLLKTGLKSWSSSYAPDIIGTHTFFVASEDPIKNAISKVTGESESTGFPEFKLAKRTITPAYRNGVFYMEYGEPTVKKTIRLSTDSTEEYKINSLEITDFRFAYYSGYGGKLVEYDLDNKGSRISIENYIDTSSNTVTGIDISFDPYELNLPCGGPVVIELIYEAYTATSAGARYTSAVVYAVQKDPIKKAIEEAGVGGGATDGTSVDYINTVISDEASANREVSMASLSARHTLEFFSVTAGINATLQITPSQVEKTYSVFNMGDGDIKIEISNTERGTVKPGKYVTITASGSDTAPAVVVTEGTFFTGDSPIDTTIDTITPSATDAIPVSGVCDYNEDAVVPTASISTGSYYKVGSYGAAYSGILIPISVGSNKFIFVWSSHGNYNLNTNKDYIYSCLLTVSGSTVTVGTTNALSVSSYAPSGYTAQSYYDAVYCRNGSYIIVAIGAQFTKAGATTIMRQIVFRLNTSNGATNTSKEISTNTGTYLGDVSYALCCAALPTGNICILSRMRKLVNATTVADTEDLVLFILNSSLSIVASKVLETYPNTKYVYKNDSYMFYVGDSANGGFVVVYNGYHAPDSVLRNLKLVMVNGDTISDPQVIKEIDNETFIVPDSQAIENVYSQGRVLIPYSKNIRDSDFETAFGLIDLVVNVQNGTFEMSESRCGQAFSGGIHSYVNLEADKWLLLGFIKNTTSLLVSMYIYDAVTRKLCNGTRPDYTGTFISSVLQNALCFTVGTPVSRKLPVAFVAATGSSAAPNRFTLYKLVIDLDERTVSVLKGATPSIGTEAVSQLSWHGNIKENFGVYSNTFLALINPWTSEGGYRPSAIVIS